MKALNRRSLMTGIGMLIAAPAIVRASSLMPVRAYSALSLYGFGGDVFEVTDLVYELHELVPTPVHVVAVRMREVIEKTDVRLRIRPETVHYDNLSGPTFFDRARIGDTFRRFILKPEVAL
jgi:hypothetical protein